MTKLYFTIDTEYEFGFSAARGKGSRAENFAQSIAGRVGGGEAGIFYQMDVFDACGMKAVFFVDPMPALLWGTAAVADVVGPIMARGHDVQLHLHTEWLALAGAANPVGTKTGRNLKDFTLDEQCTLLDWGRSVLVEAGAHRPTAFRAGNYGANDDTLRALASLGFTHDSNHTPGIANTECAIGLASDDRTPVTRHGVVEVPVDCIGDPFQGLRHAQLTALSHRELVAALRHARDTGRDSFTLVSHSFELIDRKRQRPSPILIKRFARLCERFAGLQGVASGTFRDDPPRPAAEPERTDIMPSSYLLAGERMVQQALVNAGG